MALYAGLFTTPGKVVKVNIPALTKVSTLTFAAGLDEISPHSMIISEGYLYAGVQVEGEDAGTIVKVRLSDFTVVDTLTLEAGEDLPTGMAVSEGYLYVGLWTDPGRVVKIDLSTFTRVDALDLSVGESDITCVIISGSYLYAGTVKAGVTKIDLTTFTETALLGLSGAPWDFAISGDYLYAGESHHIDKIDLTTFTLAGSLDFPGVVILAVATSGNYLYAGTEESPATIVRIDLTTGDQTLLTLDAGENKLNDFFISDNYLYGGLLTGPGKIVKVNLTTFTKDSTLTLDAGENAVTALDGEVEVVIAPTVTTNPASSISQTSATLNGILAADGGEACECGFEWGETIAYEHGATPTESKVTGETFSQAIGLTPGTTYHFRAFATNSAGTSYGADRSFTTLSAVVIPTVTTVGYGSATVHSAVLEGRLDDDGGEACDCCFEYGPDTSYGTTTVPQSKSTGDSFRQLINGLTRGITYHFRAKATNSVGTAYGADMTFMTIPFTINRSYALSRHEL